MTTREGGTARDDPLGQTRSGDLSARSRQERGAPPPPADRSGVVRERQPHVVPGRPQRSALLGQRKRSDRVPSPPRPGNARRPLRAYNCRRRGSGQAGAAPPSSLHRGRPAASSPLCWQHCRLCSAQFPPGPRVGGGAGYRGSAAEVGLPIPSGASPPFRRASHRRGGARRPGGGPARARERVGGTGWADRPRLGRARAA